MSESIELLLEKMNAHLKAKNRKEFFEVGEQVKNKLKERGLYTLDLNTIWCSRMEQELPRSSVSLTSTPKNWSPFDKKP